MLALLTRISRWPNSLVARRTMASASLICHIGFHGNNPATVLLQVGRDHSVLFSRCLKRAPSPVPNLSRRIRTGPTAREAFGSKAQLVLSCLCRSYDGTRAGRLSSEMLRNRRSIRTLAVGGLSKGPNRERSSKTILRLGMSAGAARHLRKAGSAGQACPASGAAGAGSTSSPVRRPARAP
jgi:hypothetical protein